MNKKKVEVIGIDPAMTPPKDFIPHKEKPAETAGEYKIRLLNEWYHDYTPRWIRIIDWFAFRLGGQNNFRRFSHYKGFKIHEKPNGETCYHRVIQKKGKGPVHHEFIAKSFAMDQEIEILPVQLADANAEAVANEKLTEKDKKKYARYVAKYGRPGVRCPDISLGGNRFPVQKVSGKYYLMVQSGHRRLDKLRTAFPEVGQYLMRSDLP